MTPILTVTLNPTIDASGEADMVRPTRKTRMTALRHDPGGGGINVARVVEVLGGRAEALYLAGGEMGDFLDRLLEEKGIHRHRIPIKGQTRIAYMVREKSTGHEYRLIPEGAAVTAAEIQPCFEAIAARSHGYVVASGSLPPGAPEDTYAKMAGLAADRNVRFVLDTSGAGLRQALKGGGIFLVKPSRGELEQYAGHKLTDNDLQHVAMDIVGRRAADAVAVTLGPDGALLATSSGVIWEPAIHVRVRSAVGSGDSFVGAMVWALAEGHDFPKAFHLGMAAGAAAAMTPGTELCRRDDVFRLCRATF